MVSTRRANGQAVAPDDNRMIVVVTGANSGFGLGICQQLLSNLSLPPGTPLPASTPQRSALPPTEQHLLDSSPEPTKHVPRSPPPTLTLILACRSQHRAEDARQILLSGHEKELVSRKKRGVPVREGWQEGLRIVWEGVDLDAVGGKNGTLAFCERLKSTYPHITTMFLNAGLGAFKGNNYPAFAWQVLTQGYVRTVTDPEFQLEIPGLTSADGERGMVWGVNVLAPYILIKELSPLLERSPRTLPFPPRIIYVSSCTALLSYLHPNPLDDYQLLSYGTSAKDSLYKASKYSGDVVMVQLDRELAKTSNGQNSIRVFTTDPGCVQTNIFDQGFGPWKVYREVMKFFYWLSFYFARLLGSTVHTVYAKESALAMLYAALVDEKYVQAADKVPAQKFKVHAGRWGKTTVDYGEVDHWEDSLDIGQGMVKACEAVRKEWRRREVLE